MKITRYKADPTLMKQKKRFTPLTAMYGENGLRKTSRPKARFGSFFPRKNRENRHFPITMPWKKRFVSAGSTAQQDILTTSTVSAVSRPVRISVITPARISSG